MTFLYSEKNKQNAQNLRRAMTKEERHLWYDFLRTYPVKFYRQRRIDNYIVDFYCRKAQIVIELDGGQHYDEQARQYDTERTRLLNNRGLHVLRFTNIDINQHFREVCVQIDEYVKSHS